MAMILVAPLAWQPFTANSDVGLVLPKVAGVSDRDMKTALKTRLLQPEDLEYVGAFRVPADQINGTSFAYGGTALAYNPQRKSLFLVGHDWQQKVAEISIPKVVKSDVVTDLNVAKILQPFTDPTGGKMYTVDSGSIKVGGLLMYKNRLYGTAYSYYDGDGSQKFSHFFASPNLSNVNKQRGMFQVGDVGAGFVSRYMANIPRVWQKVLGGEVLTGNCCVSIVGRTSSGPGAFLFDPEDLGKRDVASAQPLFYYPLNHSTLGKWGETNPNFNGSTTVGGVVWPSKTRSVIFLGAHGVGPFCYGTGVECGDPINNSKGTHGYPYRYQAWAYDAADFVRVKNGEAEPWDVQPHAVWNFDLPFQGEYKGIGGVAYDARNNRIFVSQLRGEGKLPVIHVFKVAPVVKAKR